MGRFANSLLQPCLIARIPQSLDDPFEPSNRTTPPDFRQCIQFEFFERRGPARIVARLYVSPREDPGGEKRQMIGFRAWKAKESATVAQGGRDRRPCAIFRWPGSCRDEERCRGLRIRRSGEIARYRNGFVSVRQYGMLVWPLLIGDEMKWSRFFGPFARNSLEGLRRAGLRVSLRA